MRLFFFVNGEYIEFDITKERVVKLRGKHTNNKWVDFTKLMEVTKQDKQTGEMTLKIIRSLPTMKDVEWYVKQELAKHGIQHIKTVQ